ncbi:hypothetical protein PO124_34690 [Bacillus licheniformis]|nr:hypothetical protein [Bacillus licheniformis]
MTGGNIIGQLQKGIKSTSSPRKRLGKIRMNWRNASRDEVEKYVNPEISHKTARHTSNFKLSQTARLNAAEVNAKSFIIKGFDRQRASVHRRGESIQHQ